MFSSSVLKRVQMSLINLSIISFFFFFNKKRFLMFCIFGLLSSPIHSLLRCVCLKKIYLFISKTTYIFLYRFRSIVNQSIITSFFNWSYFLRLFLFKFIIYRNHNWFKKYFRYLSFNFCFSIFQISIFQFYKIFF